MAFNRCGVSQVNVKWYNGKPKSSQSSPCPAGAPREMNSSR